MCYKEEEIIRCVRSAVFQQLKIISQNEEDGIPEPEIDAEI